jgi:hypothetical protein
MNKTFAIHNSDRARSCLIKLVKMYPRGFVGSSWRANLYAEIFRGDTTARPAYYLVSMNSTGIYISFFSAPMPAINRELSNSDLYKCIYREYP